MEAGAFAFFPAGQTTGHSLLNNGPGPCSYLMIGDRNPNDVCVYADLKKMAVRELRTERAAFDMAGVRWYWDGEEAGE